MAFIATVKIFFDLISITLDQEYYTKEINKIDQRLKDDYHMMTSYQVHKLNHKKAKLEAKLINLKQNK